MAETEEEQVLFEAEKEEEEELQVVAINDDSNLLLTPPEKEEEEVVGVAIIEHSPSSPFIAGGEEIAEKEVVIAINENSNILLLPPPQPCPPPLSPFIEINCKSSGKVRRFSVGTDASFALQLINQKLDSEVPLASYIEAVKEGEESISFGPNSVLIDYGDGWQLQTVPNEVSEKHKDMVEIPYEDFPEFADPAKDNSEFLTDVQIQLQLDDPLQEVEKPIASEPVSDISQSDKMDMTDVFTTDEVFNNRDELVKWTRAVGRSVGVVVVIKKSNSAKVGRPPRMEFWCERSGKCRADKKGVKKQKIRQTGTKKCDCPFTLKGIKMPKEDQWRIKVHCGFHNHPLRPHSEGHSHSGKLTPEEKSIVRELLVSGVKPKEVLTALKERDQYNAATVRTIYNARQKLKLTRKRLKTKPEETKTEDLSVTVVEEMTLT